MHFYSYKIKPVHLLQEGDLEIRKAIALQFFAWMMIVVDSPWNVLLSWKTHFYLYGQVNTHNCQFCARKNPRVIQEQPLCPKKWWYIVVYCHLHHCTVIFQTVTANGNQTCSVTGQRHHDMLRYFLEGTSTACMPWWHHFHAGWCPSSHWSACNIMRYLNCKSYKVL